MHELITGAAAIILISLFIFQFAANENLFLETVEIQRTVERYTEEEYSEEEADKAMEDLAKELNNVPNTRAERLQDDILITIDKVIGPAASCGISDNSITIRKRIDLKIREDTNEESDNDSGTPDADGASEQISDGYQSDGAISDIDHLQEELSNEEISN